MNQAQIRNPDAAGGADEIPVGCGPHVFSDAERVAHLDLSREVLILWPTRREELDDGFVFSYEGTEERFLSLARWAAAEHRCCPWASYSVEMAPFQADAPGAIRIRVTASPAGKAFLTSAYQYLDQLQGRPPPDSILNPDGKLRHASILEKLKAGCKC